jgi:glycosyltransferase involved in cell wall biosynthesis
VTIALAAPDRQTALGRRASSLHWIIVTGEYPPDCGGVGDYTRLVACGLAGAGDSVTVWTPPSGSAVPRDRGVTVRQLPDRYGIRSLRMLTRVLEDRRAPARILIQYVPHAFGLKGGNLPFSLWLYLRRRHRPWVMFHEVAYPFEARAPMRRRALALVNRVMARLVSRAAHRAFVSIPAWRTDVERFARPDTSIEWLPVPSTLPAVDDPEASRAVRDRYAPRRPLIGVFGTFGARLRTDLNRCLPLIADQSDAAFLLLGRGSDRMAGELASARPEWTDRIHASGPLPEGDLSIHIRACDLMLQPYPDGASTRRTSAMAALAHERPLVTTTGALTEAFWALDRAAALVPADNPEELARAAVALLAAPDERASLGARGLAVYRARFDVAHTVKALRRSA